MTIKFQNTIANLMIGRGFLAGFSATAAITIYSGTQPTAAQITAAWASYNSSSANCLAHYLDGVWSQPSNNILLQLTPPAAVAAAKTGNAAWAILWSTNLTQVLLNGATLPNTAFIVVPVSVVNGSGVIRFTDLSFTATVSKSIFDGSLSAVGF